METTIMTIADLIKYIDLVKKRLASLDKTIQRTEITSTGVRVVNQSADTQVLEETKFTINPKSLMAEYDECAKELRLAQATLERFNHTTDTGFVAKY